MRSWAKHKGTHSGRKARFCKISSFYGLTGDSMPSKRDWKSSPGQSTHMNHVCHHLFKVHVHGPYSQTPACAFRKIPCTGCEMCRFLVMQNIQMPAGPPALSCSLSGRCPPTIQALPKTPPCLRAPHIQVTHTLTDTLPNTARVKARNRHSR